MLEKIPRFLLICTATVASLILLKNAAGCSTETSSSEGGSRSAQTGVQNKGSTSALSTEVTSNTNETNEDSQSDVPQAVAGAFLCNTINPSKAKERTSDSNSELVGCAVVDNDQKIDLSKYKIELTFKKASDGQVAGKIEKAPDIEKWHLWGFVDRSNLKDLVAYLTVSLDGKSIIKNFQFPLKDLIPWTEAQGDKYSNGT